jgi:CheY-like chemotaxis protein
LRVLLIDDDPVIAEDLDLLLPGHIELEWVAGSEAAIKRLQSEELPDAIILDLCLPRHLADSDDGEGLHLMSLLHKELAVGLPVVVLSSLSRAEMESECLSRGARAYVEKPCTVRDLTELLQALANPNP